MKQILFTMIVLLCIQANMFAQKDTTKVLTYNPNADAKKELNEAIQKAAKENKQVLVQVGGNWCKWCVKVHKFYNADKQLDSMIKANYVLVMLNYSKENKNPEMMKQLEFPNRFGFPVFVILDNKGKRLHTQNSSYLEEGDGYSKEKIMDFLKGWTVVALDPTNYK